LENFSTVIFSHFDILTAEESELKSESKLKSKSESEPEPEPRFSV
jgi:hypothetical protein